MNGANESRFRNAVAEYRFRPKGQRANFRGVRIWYSLTQIDDLIQGTADYLLRSERGTDYVRIRPRLEADNG